ncbi:MAG: hypothetical protein KDD73_00980 [Anaerolineales bacterium]|nr:hypothetical protein [Anaerolineales bacterium]MCB9129124.1 ATPase [Ardenticatenales bacterium]
MSELTTPTVLCFASYQKGEELLRELKRCGCTVLLLTLEELADGPWPMESIDDRFLMPSLDLGPDVIHAVSYLARSHQIDLILPLDDFDVETVAAVREHLRISGMGETTARYFRDKLAMRVKARDERILVPEFVHVLNYDALAAWMARVPPPWVLKPRSEASAVGIKRIHHADELWPALEMMGDRQSYYVLEKYVPGRVYHVDAIVWEREILFAECHVYAAPPLDVMQEGGIFSTITVARGSEDERTLRRLNRELLQALGLVHGVTHTEFIKHDQSGDFYFLETASRVGGANIDIMVEAATGVNLWREWARLEVAALRDEPYQLPDSRTDYAATVISLARQTWPETSAYDWPEIVWRLHKEHHAGLILADPSHERVQTLVYQTIQRFAHDFMTSLPAPDKPTS